jgi:hypothetical protein
MTEVDGDLFGVAGLWSQLMHVGSHRKDHPITIHLDGRIGDDRDPVNPSPRLGTETLYSSSAERRSSMWLTPRAVASSYRLTIVGSRRPCSRPVMYCWLKPESPPAAPGSGLLLPGPFDVPPDQLAHVHAVRSADNDQLIIRWRRTSRPRRRCTDVASACSKFHAEAGSVFGIHLRIYARPRPASC